MVATWVLTKARDKTDKLAFLGPCPGDSIEAVIGGHESLCIILYNYLDSGTHTHTHTRITQPNKRAIIFAHRRSRFSSAHKVTVLNFCKCSVYPMLRKAIRITLLKVPDASVWNVCPAYPQMKRLHDPATTPTSFASKHHTCVCTHDMRTPTFTPKFLSLSSARHSLS